MCLLGNPVEAMANRCPATLRHWQRKGWACGGGIREPEGRRGERGGAKPGRPWGRPCRYSIFIYRASRRWLHPGTEDTWGAGTPEGSSHGPALRPFRRRSAGTGHRPRGGCRDRHPPRKELGPVGAGMWWRLGVFDQPGLHGMSTGPWRIGVCGDGQALATGGGSSPPRPDAGDARGRARMPRPGASGRSVCKAPHAPGCIAAPVSEASVCVAASRAIGLGGMLSSMDSGAYGTMRSLDKRDLC
jgi:hypothetical protein